MTEPPSAAGSITARVLRGAGWMMAWRFVSRSLGFVSVLVLAGLLVPEDFGIVAMASAVTGSIESMSQLGVRDALVRLADDRRDFYDTAFTFQVGRGLLTALLIAVMSLFARDLLGEARLHDVLLVLAALALVSGCENIGVVGFSRRLDFRSQFLLQAGPRVFGFVVTTALAFLLRSYWALIIGSVAAKLVGVGMSYSLSPHRPRFGIVGWQYLLHFSFWSWAGSLAIIVLARADPFLLGPVLGVAAVGLITLAADVAYLPISELLEPACTALFPGFAMANRSGSPPAAMGLSIAGALALLTIPLSIGVSACSGYLVASLLGPKWDDAQPIIAILAWVCMFSPFSYVSGSVLSAHGQVSRVFASHAIAAVLKIAILLAVRHTNNLQLIVFASMMTVVAETVIFVWQLRQAGSQELLSLAKTMGRALLSTMLTVVVVSQLPGAWSMVPLDRWAALLAGGALGASTILLFAACQTGLWLWAGQPAGPGGEAGGHRAAQPASPGGGQLGDTVVFPVLKGDMPRLLAFYLPQFHPIPENDEWWGKGFTEWTNTAKAKPLFGGHYQPHVPADLGFYDLRVPEVRAQQAELARSRGIEGFCYYHYWFAGRRVLERPLDEVVSSGAPDYPFCVCWANETWTGIWHGSPGRVLIEQTYPGPADHARHFEALLPAFTDPRYIRVDGKPLFIIYKAHEVPEPQATLALWRSMAERAGLPGLYIVGYETTVVGATLMTMGYDAVIKAPKIAQRGWISRREPKRWLREQSRIRRGLPTIVEFADWAKQNVSVAVPGYDSFPCVVHAWDNTPRSGARGVVLRSPEPAIYATLLRAALATVADKPVEKRFVFLKSWNEWAEGNHLEPDLRYSTAYLDVLAETLKACGR